MRAFLDTSTPTCKLTLISDTGEKYDYEWLAERELAKGLHAFINEKLQLHGSSWNDISGIGVYQGPGSYTGLRIGLTVLNTLADALSVPVIGATGESWQSEAIARLESGENDQIVLPEYGGEANITAPRK